MFEICWGGSSARLNEQWIDKLISVTIEYTIKLYQFEF